MRSLAATVVLAVGVGSGFGDATAETVSLDETSMIVSIEVEVTTTADAVIARLASPGNETVVLPLLDRGGGIFGIRTEVSPIDYRVTFEILSPQTLVSDPVSLSAMGATFGSEIDDAPPTTDGATGLSTQTRRWGWLALALAAASLAVLAVWVVVGGREGRVDANATANDNDKAEDTDASERPDD